MKLLEYEAKQIINSYAIPIPKSFIIKDTPEFLPVVVKSQVPIGGRGKAGGVAICTTPTEFFASAQKIKTTPIKGFLPTTLLAEEVIPIARELYLSLLIDKKTAKIMVVAHTNGGIEVENNSDDFFRRTIDQPSVNAVGTALADYYNLPDKTFLLQELLLQLYACFCKNDVLLLEINPFIITKDGSFVAGDCKMELDDAAAFRHQNWQFEQQPQEVNFITLNQHGQVATIANGAGLAMATVDAVADAGLNPANFLDIGGGATEQTITAAFTRIATYQNIVAIIINIFAGITRCDEVAKAIIAAKQTTPTLPPLFIRLSGTNFEQAAALLAQHNITVLSTLEDCLHAAKEHTQ